MKTKPAFLLLWSLAGAFLCGCHTVGHEFKLPNADSLQLGKAPPDFYKLPRNRYSVNKTRNEAGDFEVVNYLQIYEGWKRTRQRQFTMEMRNGRLNGYAFASSFTEDKITFEQDRIQEIKPKISSKEDVIRILGRPYIRALCPTTIPGLRNMCENSAEVWSWIALREVPYYDAPYHPNALSVYVTFDASGKVADVQSFGGRRDSMPAWIVIPGLGGF